MRILGALMSDWRSFSTKTKNSRSDSRKVTVHRYVDVNSLDGIKPNGFKRSTASLNGSLLAEKDVNDEAVVGKPDPKSASSDSTNSSRFIPKMNLINSRIDFI